MHLWSGPSSKFVQDAIQNRVAEDLKEAFFRYNRYNPAPSEVASWRNSLRAMSQVVQHAGLEDNGILLEYQLPLNSKRLDCMVTGEDDGGKARAVIVELKQWERAVVAEGDYVMTFVGGAQREVLHPSVQVGGYRTYLADMHDAFYGDGAIALNACSYLHNYKIEPDDPLYDVHYTSFVADAPVFGLENVDMLSNYLTTKVGGGSGLPLLDRVTQSRFRPSKKLMDHVSGVIAGTPQYNLLDEQLLVFDKVRTLLRRPLQEGRRSCVLIKGGPGTGKSVIAINLMADALKEGYNTHYATGSKAFTETLRKIMGHRGSSLFTYFNSYRKTDPGEVDLLVADEAHRIRETSEHRFMAAKERTGKPQIDELFEASKVTAFFIDDRQVVRPNEIGSAQRIRDAAKAAGLEFHEYELDIQFRCGGSEAFVNWIENTLGIRRTPNIIWEGHPEFEFRIVDDPNELDALIRAKAAAGHTARMAAGFCWPWSNPDMDGQLPADVIIEEADFARPWNAKSSAGKLAPGIPKESLWAYENEGLDQIGCIYTAQGFEFDYAGVIFGPDLRYDPKAGEWIGDKKACADNMVKRSKDQFTDLIKNTYRVLLSRGMKGCYVYFMDEGTRNFFRSRMDIQS